LFNPHPRRLREALVARVDARRAPILLADSAFRAVVVPAGGRIDFLYRLPGMPGTGSISLVAELATILAAAGRGRRLNRPGMKSR
jgi:hypothetical protein